MKKGFMILFAVLLLVSLLPLNGEAQKKYLRLVNQTCGVSINCAVCHIDPKGGGALTTAGLTFRDAGHNPCVFCPDSASCQTSCEPSETSCTDGVDNDCNGTVDCADPACSTNPACCLLSETFCADTVDNDCDGHLDCADPDCVQDPACTTCTANEQGLCSDALDNDCDGALDCADADCVRDPVCNGGGCTVTEPVESSCSDSLDNDCDGLVDCADPACSTTSVCTTSGGGSGGETSPKNAFNIMMNYELGMHCTGFEFSYCCILPPYNSILAQVVRTEKGGGKPRLLEADPNVGLDGLGRPTVVRDLALDANGNFKKYVLDYWHDAQPRNDGRGAPQTGTLISRVEGNSLLMWNTKFDAAALNPNGTLKTGTYHGAEGVILGDGDYTDSTDNYANGWLNHFYIYADLEGSNPNNSSLDSDKIRLGVQGHVEYPENVGAALHPMGPGVAGAGFDNVLTFSGEHGTIVYTQSKVLENLPVMLTAPRIWEALGLPLTPFEDTINFFGDPGGVDEDSVRPYVQMKAELRDAATNQAVLDQGVPVRGLGTAPIDIPNCERCHALANSVNAANPPGSPQYALVMDEMNFWNCYYGIDTAAGDSDWYSRLKGAAISILSIHDIQHGTSFTANFPATFIDCGTGQLSGDTSDIVQKTRLGGETVLCQRCHADNVIAAVKSATKAGSVIMPLTEAMHNNHKDNLFSDALGRNGGCQGCHPAHRSDGSLDGYPITLDGLNAYANGDNRDAAGGCYVGRDVHSNPYKDTDGAGTPSHLNAIGKWLLSNVALDTGTWKGIWCTNCHSQLGQELWRTDNMTDAINGIGDTARDEPTLKAVATALGISEAQAIAWLDPKNNEDTAAIWSRTISDANVATIEVSTSASGCGTRTPAYNARFGVYVCVDLDADGDPSVRILDFCTTPDCVTAAQSLLATEGNGSIAAPVPFDAATDGRDHWLSPGEPHCADCHVPPYVENSGHNNPYPPFNYPRKYALFRYSRGHQDISCQGCHESIHGLYPVTPDIDTTTYAQAAGMNTDGSHGPLKCGACHVANSSGVNKAVAQLTYKGQPIGQNYDAAVSWAHTYTDESDPRDNICLRCHVDNRAFITATNGKWNSHSKQNRVSRATMDKVEILQNGHVNGDPAFEDPMTTVCKSCHGDRTNTLASKRCTTRWKDHLIEGRASESVWEHVSRQYTGGTCGY